MEWIDRFVQKLKDKQYADVPPFVIAAQEGHIVKFTFMQEPLTSVFVAVWQTEELFCDITMEYQTQQEAETQIMSLYMHAPVEHEGVADAMLEGALNAIFSVYHSLRIAKE